MFDDNFAIHQYILNSLRIFMWFKISDNIFRNMVESGYIKSVRFGKNTRNYYIVEDIKGKLIEPFRDEITNYSYLLGVSGNSQTE